MKKFLFTDTEGNPLYTASPQMDDTYESGSSYNGALCIEVPLEADDNELLERCYVKSGQVKVRPEAPLPHHDWNMEFEVWLPNLNAAREAKRQQVAAELNTRLYLPCNGFDADKVSRERISGMIARLQRGDGLPAGWIGWRDASNRQQWITDNAATVLANLTVLSRAIEDREQALLIAAWEHKAAIAALTGIDGILAYNVTTGWPT